jgi:xanthine dehydrogenase YagR molybdenum-binding subunit
MSKIQNAVIGTVRTALGYVPGSWLPGGTPDPLAEKRVTLGSQVARIDGPLKVRGEARFAGEIGLNGMTYASLAFSTIARGRIARIDAEAAKAAPGVVLVMTYMNAPRMSVPPAIGIGSKGAGNSTLPIMQSPEIHWNGEPVAVVLAETQEQADFAAELIEVTYEAGPAQTRFEDAKKNAATPSSLLFEKNLFQTGDAEKALTEAGRKVDAVYRTPFHNHNAIELHAATLAWEGDRLIVHDATQMLANTAYTLAKVFGLKDDQVHVSSPFVGGGFGGKGLWSHQILAAAASKLAGRPVRLVLTREAVYRIVGGRARSEQRVALAVREENRLAALIHTGFTSVPTHSICPEHFSFASRHSYAADAMRIVQQTAHMDILANTFMRAPGESIGTFACESAVDELAHELGIDPIELRLRWEPERDPTSGAEFSQRAVGKIFRDGAERFGWSRRHPEPRSRKESEWLVGMGCATGTFPYARMPGGSVRLRLNAGGHLTVETATHEMGMGTATVQSQHAADRLGLPLDRVTFKYGDTALPDGGFAGGSSQTATLAAGISAAAQALLKDLLRLAGNDSPIAGLRPDDVDLRDGGIAKRDEPNRFESYSSILSRARCEEVTVTASGAPPLEMLKYSMHSHSAIFCELRVSEVTGEIRVTRVLGAFDCGRILNPKTAASQFRGGIIMGLGLALMEETLLDERSGRIMNPSLAEYHMPVHMDVPEIDVIWTDIPDPRSPLGARGIGEIGITGVAAAVANAVFNATGRRVRNLPITLDKVL